MPSFQPCLFPQKLAGGTVLTGGIQDGLILIQQIATYLIWMQLISPVINEPVTFPILKVFFRVNQPFTLLLMLCFSLWGQHGGHLLVFLCVCMEYWLWLCDWLKLLKYLAAWTPILVHPVSAHGINRLYGYSTQNNRKLVHTHVSCFVMPKFTIWFSSSTSGH